MRAEDFDIDNVKVDDVHVMRGNTVILECNVNPSYAERYSSVLMWYKGSQIISNGKCITSNGKWLYIYTIADHT